ncbi:hypothetical protein HMPREF0262_01251 [Clostridium sp. ATCC 29733]|nr:hypothetical protein HMPREF0262_01251 [Clostridium sp. ATCC 29733]
MRWVFPFPIFQIAGHAAPSRGGAPGPMLSIISVCRPKNNSGPRRFLKLGLAFGCRFC